MRVYSGGCGSYVAYRVEGNRVWSGDCGNNIAYRIEGNKVLSGSCGYHVAYRIEGNRIMSFGGFMDLASENSKKTENVKEDKP